MADRQDWDRERRNRERAGESTRPRGETRGREDWERDSDREPDRDWRNAGTHGDWVGTERGWEGRTRSDEWNEDRRSEYGGLDRGTPSQNREPFGSRSETGYRGSGSSYVGNRASSDWERNRTEGDPNRTDWDRHRSQAERDREPWSGENRSRADWQRENQGRRDSYREGGWSDTRFGGQQNWSSQGNYGGSQSGERYGRGSGQSYGMGGASGAYGGGMATYSERGRFTGRGPKGWQRSDDRIREDINERLTQHPDVDATDIDVQVKSGEVTLTGTVDERHAKRLAEDIAEEVSGVREVNNQIRIQHRNQTNPMGAGHSTPEITGGSKT